MRLPHLNTLKQVSSSALGAGQQQHAPGRTFPSTHSSTCGRSEHVGSRAFHPACAASKLVSRATGAAGHPSAQWVLVCVLSAPRWWWRLPAQARRQRWRRRRQPRARRRQWTARRRTARARSSGLHTPRWDITGILHHTAAAATRPQVILYAGCAAHARRLLLWLLSWTTLPSDAGAGGPSACFFIMCETLQP